MAYVDDVKSIKKNKRRSKRDEVWTERIAQGYHERPLVTSLKSAGHFSKTGGLTILTSSSQSCEGDDVAFTFSKMENEF